MKGCSHITGGGFYENVPRMLDGRRPCSDQERQLSGTSDLHDAGRKKAILTEEMMYNTFNMGLGMVVAVDPADVDKTMEAMQSSRRYTLCDW